MRVDLRSPNIDIDEALRTYSHRRVHFALSRFSNKIERVALTVSDINGPRGGVDKRCGVQIRGRSGWSVMVMHTEESTQLAVSHAVARAARTVARRIERERAHDRASLESARVSA